MQVRNLFSINKDLTGVVPVRAVHLAPFRGKYRRCDTGKEALIGKDIFRSRADADAAFLLHQLNELILEKSLKLVKQKVQEGSRNEALYNVTRGKYGVCHFLFESSVKRPHLLLEGVRAL